MTMVGVNEQFLMAHQHNIGSSCEPLLVELVEPMQQFELMWDKDVNCLFKKCKIGMACCY